jgi:hypothetical protein
MWRCSCVFHLQLPASCICGCVPPGWIAMFSSAAIKWKQASLCRGSQGRPPKENSGLSTETSANGFYAWLRTPLSKRACEDERQIGLLRKAWEESGKVYGYRKRHDDLLDHGETSCPNRVARLTHCRDKGSDWLQAPSRYLRGQAFCCHRQHAGSAIRRRGPGQSLGHRHNLHPNQRRLRLSRGGD